MQTILIKDETIMGDVVNELTLHFNTEKITVAELIRTRVEQEVEKYQQSVQAYQPHTLVTPSDIEQRLNKAKNQRKAPKIDIEKQVKLAQQAFSNNGFFILFNETQVEQLDQELLVTPQSKVSFIKLTPLVGG